MPYGFLNDPGKRLPPADPNRGEPVFTPAMKGLRAQDRLVPWRQVVYEVGEIQNHWRLIVNLMNRVGSLGKVILYRFSPTGNEGELWRKDNPSTSIEIETEGAPPSQGKRTARRFETGDMHRIDSFDFAGVDLPLLGRQSGTAVIHVDDKTYRFTVPSSLFKFSHGTAQPTHSQWVRESDMKHWDD